MLDVGARDGYISRLLTSQFTEVCALDLCKPNIQHERVTCVEGNIASLPFPDGHFDAVVCAEVLEHVSPSCLTKGCREIMRVAKRSIVIGVPYKQDIRVGRTTCSTCGKKNPPYGHVNRFDENRLKKLFSGLCVERIAHIGKHRSQTTGLAAMLMDLAGNPYGTYDQEEPCIHCGSKLVQPGNRTVGERVLAKLGHNLTRCRQALTSPRPIWIHVSFRKFSS